MNEAVLAFSSGGTNYISNSNLGGQITISNIDLTEMTIFGSFSGQVVNNQMSEDILTLSNGVLFNVNFTVQ